MGNKWTEAELAALDQVASSGGMEAYRAWGELMGFSKSYDAFEVKRRRRLGSQPTAVELAGPGVRPEPVLADPSSYVGFNIVFWDLETTFSTQPIVLFGAGTDVFGRVTEFRKGKDITNDRELVQSIAEYLNAADVWVTWNGKLFDVPVLNGRLRFHGLPPLQKVKHIDLMYYATGGSMRIGRRSLQSVSEYFDVPNRKTPLSVRIWDKAMAGDKKAYELIAEHGAADVLVTRDVFNILKTQIATVTR